MAPKSDLQCQKYGNTNFTSGKVISNMLLHVLRWRTDVIHISCKRVCVKNSESEH